MTDETLFGAWLRRFLVEYLVLERSLSKNTQRSYRDTFRLLLRFAVQKSKKRTDEFLLSDITPDLLRDFLLDIEKSRGCSASTRNQRLAAIHSLASFVSIHSPEALPWCAQVRAITMKRSQRPCITYLEKSEMEAILDAPTLSTPQGRRDHALLLFLYNSGARADEAAQAKIEDLTISSAKSRDNSFVLIHGKGGKQRRCPLWANTVAALLPLIHGRGDSEHIFLNRCQRPITRFGIHTMVERCTERAVLVQPSLSRKKVSPHTIRHTTATHLLKAGVDINTIRAWLGHVSLSTTNIYAEVDLEMKAKALAKCEVTSGGPRKKWNQKPGLLEFLSAL